MHSVAGMSSLSPVANATSDCVAGSAVLGWPQGSGGFFRTGDGRLLLVQLGGLLMIILWAIINSLALLFVLHWVSGASIRASSTAEVVGLDQYEHGVDLAADFIQQMAVSQNILAGMSPARRALVRGMLRKFLDHEDSNENKNAGAVPGEDTAQGHRTDKVFTTSPTMLTRAISYRKRKRSAWGEQVDRVSTLNFHEMMQGLQKPNQDKNSDSGRKLWVKAKKLSISTIRAAHSFQQSASSNPTFKRTSFIKKSPPTSASTITEEHEQVPGGRHTR